MFLLSDMLYNRTSEFNDIKDMMEFIDSEWLHGTPDFDRLGAIVGNMKEGEVFECTRFKIRCISENLLVRKIWLGSDAATAPAGYYRTDTVNKAKNAILYMKSINFEIEHIVISKEIEASHQADGGSLEKFKDWYRYNDIKIPVFRKDEI